MGNGVKDTLPIWVEFLKTSKANKDQLKSISAATIDRLLKDFKVQSGKKPRPPKPASRVKSLVEIRVIKWHDVKPSWIEVDTVTHCGVDMGGS